MIQRIQTVYLFLAIISVVAFDFIPFGSMKIDAIGSTSILVAKNNMVFVIISGIIALIAQFAILLFKNRILQMRLVLFNIVLSVALIGMFVYELIEHVGIANYAFGIGAIIPIFILFFNILAYFSIKSDEKLVRSMDRLR